MAGSLANYPVTPARPEHADSPKAPRPAVLPTWADKARFDAAHYLKRLFRKALKLDPGFAPGSRLSELSRKP
jgi:hypothetical protein